MRIKIQKKPIAGQMKTFISDTRGDKDQSATLVAETAQYYV
jgi:hypothetical protein